jgi:opacity protein-like surface antigen
MKKIITVIATCLSFAFVAAAADTPRTEAFIGYQFTRFNADSGHVPSFNANGGSGQFVYNFYEGLGIAVDGGAVTKGIINQADVDTTVAHLVAGPRYQFHNSSKWTPFVEALFGGAYATTSTQIALVPPVVTPFAGTVLGNQVSARLIASRTSFAMMTGGGVDWRFSKHVSLRPVAFDYYLTRPANVISGDNVNKNNWRYTAGINFTFGAK